MPLELPDHEGFSAAEQLSTPSERTIDSIRDILTSAFLRPTERWTRLREFRRRNTRHCFRYWLTPFVSPIQGEAAEMVGKRRNDPRKNSLRKRKTEVT